MILRYEIWDMESANQIASFEAKEEAIAVVTDYLRLNGVASASQLVLGAIYRDGAGTLSMIPVLDGDDVVAIARAGSAIDLSKSVVLQFSSATTMGVRAVRTGTDLCPRGAG